MMKRIAALAALLLLASLAFAQGGYGRHGDRGYVGRGYSTGGGLAAAAPVDTIKIVSGFATYVNTAANPEYVYDDSYYDYVNRSDDGTYLRYGTAYETVPDAVYSSTTSVISRGRSAEDNSASSWFTALMWHSTRGLPANCKIQEAFVVFNHYGQNDVASGGYVSVRVDTVDLDYEILTSLSTTADPATFDMTYNEVDNTNNRAWVPSLDDRDDWHDFGPRSKEKNMAVYTGIPKGTVQKFDLTDAVQQVVNNGDIERGLLMVIASKGIGNHTYAMGTHETVASTGLGGPELVVIATTESGADPWNGKRVPVGLSLDDGYARWADWYPTMVAEGIPFNPFYTGNRYEALAYLDSLYSPNSADITFGAHAYGGDMLGDISEALQNTYLEKDGWMIGANFAAGVPDTSFGAMDFAWPGGQPNKYGMSALKKLYTYGYRSGRGTNKRDAATTDIGAITYPSWNGYTNIMAYVAPAAGSIFEDITEPDSVATKATMEEALMDMVDIHYTDGLQAAVMLYGHTYDIGGFGEHITVRGLEWYDEIIDSKDFLHHMSTDEMITLLRGKGVKTLAEVDSEVNTLRLNAGATDSLYYYDIELTSAIQDSAQTADSHTVFDNIWFGPNEE